MLDKADGYRWGLFLRSPIIKMRLVMKRLSFAIIRFYVLELVLKRALGSLLKIKIRNNYNEQILPKN